MSNPSSTRHALKEWAVVIEALREGRQAILLRKGGIHEPHGDPGKPRESFFLFPGFEHQRPDLLKPAEAIRYADRLDPALESGALRIDTLAHLDEVIALEDARQAHRLRDLHIWSDDYVRMRIDYRPERPLQLFLLRVHALPAPIEIPRLPRYAGCRSWVELEEALSADGARPVLDDAALERLRRDVLARIARSG